MRIGSGDNRHPSEEVNQVHISHRPDGAYLRGVGYGLVRCQEAVIFLQQGERVVAQADQLVEIAPGVFETFVIGCPGMFMQVSPESSVEPIASADRNKSLVGGEGL